MKIKVGASNPHATRVVFDEEGNVRNPLELLAMEDEGREDAEGNAEGLDVGVHASSGTRMQRIAEIMRKRDQEDRKNEKSVPVLLGFGDMMKCIC